MSKNITLSLPDGTFQKMRSFTEIRWSEVARKAIEERIGILEERIGILEELEAISAKSRLTEKDVDAVSAKIRRGIARRHGKMDVKNST